jgi:6,7-dimethyl-8-ribityllumazine synthase
MRVQQSLAFFTLCALAQHLFHSYSFQGTSLSRSNQRVTRATISSPELSNKHKFVSVRNWMRYSDEEESEEEEEEEEEGEGDATVAVPVILPQEAETDALSLMKEGIKFPTTLNGTDVRIGIIMARWNADIITGLYKGVNESLTKCGVKPSNVFTTYVPGSFELPVTAKLLAMSKRVDAIICLGTLIKGDTMHFEYIAGATAEGIMKVSVENMMPVIFGVLTVLDKEQAILRSTGETNEGLSWGMSAVEMGLNRMQAMGMDKKRPASTATGKGFVVFNSSAVPTKNGTDAGNSTRKFF